MLELPYPAPDFRTRSLANKRQIFDQWRKVWVSLTEEEWVRQNFAAYLQKVVQYPASLISIEKEIMVGELVKRFDILVFDRDHKPWMMVECKAPYVSLQQQVLEQVLRYHITVPAHFLAITNGRLTRIWKCRDGGFEELQDFPAFSN